MSLPIDILVDFGWYIIIVHRHVCVRAAYGCEKIFLRIETDEEEAKLMRKISSQDIFPNKICYKHGFFSNFCVFLIRSISTLFLLLCFSSIKSIFPFLLAFFLSLL